MFREAVHVLALINADDAISREPANKRELSLRESVGRQLTATRQPK
jgi:hypothetical protein